MAQERLQIPFDDCKVKAAVQTTTLLRNAKTPLYNCNHTARMAGDNEEISHEASNGTLKDFHLNDRFNEQDPEGMGRNHGV